MAQCRNFLTKFPGKVNQTLNAEEGMEKSVLWLDAGANSIDLNRFCNYQK